MTGLLSLSLRRVGKGRIMCVCVFVDVRVQLSWRFDPAIHTPVHPPLHSSLLPLLLEREDN